MIKVLTVFGTRPEIIKLAPVIRELEARPEAFRSVNVSSSQHTDLLRPFVRLFGIRIDHDLEVMRANQTPNGVFARVLASLDPLLCDIRPDLLLVQGDTTTAAASAIAGFHHRIRVGHVEAGLRSGNAYSPFPEEMNRRIITRLAGLHFAATPQNRDALLQEGVPGDAVFVTGNPVVDSLKAILERPAVSPPARRVLEATEGLRTIVLTTHRRESFGEVMAENLRVLRRFVDRHPRAAIVFPVHPNPAVVRLAKEVLSGHERVHLVPPLDYVDFIVCLSRAWLIVSDSGGVQEEAPTLGKPLLILRENTERSEAIACGVARLTGGCPERLERMLEEAFEEGSWTEGLGRIENPFGQGDSGRRIARAILGCLEAPVEAA